MTTGLGVFIACLVLVTALAVLDCRRTWHDRSLRWAIAEAIVMGTSLAAYTAVCLWLGYSLPAQLAAAVISGIPLLAGFKFVPPFNVRTEGDHR